MKSFRYFYTILLFTLLFFSTSLLLADDLVKKGEYLFWGSGGCTCHTDFANEGPTMAGGRALEIPYGIIYSTNITPDKKTGIGNWTDEEFVLAMTQGVGPDGKNYFPAFPYPSFTKMSREDILAIKAYLFTLPPVEKENLPHEMPPPFGWRFAMSFWNILYHDDEKWKPDSSKTESWNRGSYLSEAVAHCGECHTPRNFMGALNKDLLYAGNKEGPEGDPAPNITPDKKTGIGGWSKADFVYFFQNGLKEDGDYVQGAMEEVIEHGYSNLTEEDLEAITEYFRSFPPVEY